MNEEITINKIAVFLSLFIGINFLMWGGQEIYYWADTSKINEIQDHLASEEKFIKTLEGRIAVEEIDINETKNSLENLKNLEYFDLYNKGVDDYNNLLILYRNDIDLYNSKIPDYNLKVDEVNEIIKRSGTRWYLIPIPSLGKRTHTTHLDSK